MIEKLQRNIIEKSLCDKSYCDTVDLSPPDSDLATFALPSKNKNLFPHENEAVIWRDMITDYGMYDATADKNSDFPPDDTP